MYFGEDTQALDGRVPPMLWVTAVVTAGIVGLAWIPGVNLFGLDPIAAAAAATLVN